MVDETQKNVLIEPSLLVAEHTFPQIIEKIKQKHLGEERYQFFIPSKFADMLNRIWSNTEDIKFFINKAKSINPKHLRDVLNILGKKRVIQKFKIQATEEEKFSGFYESLLRETGNKNVTEILFEEWVFLQEKSWVISRIKKPFSYLIRSGAVSIEISRRTLDLAAGGTHKKDDDDIITKAERLTTFAKWVALGEPSVLPPVNPMDRALFGAGAGYFLLFDPGHLNLL